MRFAFTIAYKGKFFSGFQIQKEERTVQAELEKAVTIILNEKIRIYTAGRTDAGVSALGQVIHLDVQSEKAMSRMDNLARFIYSMNSLMPNDISIIYGNAVSDKFHARFSALSREYAYFTYVADYKHAIFSDLGLWFRKPLNVNAMRSAAEYLTGEKDFAAFTREMVLRNNEPTRRRLDEIHIIEKKPFIIFYYKGSGFLHNMIRILTGTLIMAGREEILPADMKSILEGKKRENAGVTLPAFPLYFLNASYEEYQTPLERIPFYNYFL